MPITQPAQPLIFEIYEAFTPESLRVFRAAMERSRDGVVRVDDLVIALAEHGPGVGVEVLGEWRPSPHRPGERLVPMSNEPALREVLATAYRISAEQPSGDRLRITPAVLSAALFAGRHLPVPMPLAVIFERLGLDCPGWVGNSGPRRQAVPSPPPPQTKPLDRGAADELMDEILNEWLQMQTVPDGRDRNRQRTVVEERVRQFERLAATPDK